MNFISCQHLTLQFEGDLSRFNKHLGQQVKIKPLLYGTDENCQAVLSYIVDDQVLSTDNFTHVTVAVSNIGQYQPVYSNYFWSRVNDAAPLYIGRDSNGEVHYADLPDKSSVWKGVLPPVTINNVTYGATNAIVLDVATFYPEATTFDATVCVFSLWDDDKKICNTNPSTPIPSTPPLVV